MLGELIDSTPKKQRKNRYIPNLAASKFTPTEDWSVEDATKLYRDARFPFHVDQVTYEDCLVAIRRLPEESVDLIVADPPFGLGFSGMESIYNRDSRYVKEGYQEVGARYDDFSNRWLAEVPRVLKKSGSAWVFSGWTHVVDILNAIHRAGLTVTNHIIWRYQFGVFTNRKFVSSHYHVLFATKTQDYYFNKIMHYPLDVWDIKRTYRKGEVKNGTKLPEELVAKCIEFTTRPGDLVLDPFMGNGTTAVASLETFRHYLGFETNAAMKEVIDRNLAGATLGFMYVPYSEREDEIVTKARKRYGKPAQDLKLGEFLSDSQRAS